MNRGDIWISVEKGYLSKPRPVLIIQSDRYNKDESVVTCLVTSEDVLEKDYRVFLKKTVENGLDRDSFIMIDKIISVPRIKLNKYVGKVNGEIVEEVYRKLMDFLAA